LEGTRKRNEKRNLIARFFLELDKDEKSSLYTSGFALRFVRITKIRDDKEPREADTLPHITELYENQFKFKGKLQL